MTNDPRDYDPFAEEKKRRDDAVRKELQALDEICGILNRVPQQTVERMLDYLEKRYREPKR